MTLHKVGYLVCLFVSNHMPKCVNRKIEHVRPILSHRGTGTMQRSMFRERSFRDRNAGTFSFPQWKNASKTSFLVPGSSFLDPSFRELRWLWICLNNISTFSSALHVHLVNYHSIPLAMSSSWYLLPNCGDFIFILFSHKNNCCLLYSLMCLSRGEDHLKKKKSMSYRCESDKSDSFISEDWHQTNSYQLCVKFEIWRQRMKSSCYWITGNKLI